ncbi:MAG: hypothetical protein HFI09_02325 [Bacilli bacterium]|nr:hypothetical protein [Bacilli bacterium]
MNYYYDVLLNFSEDHLWNFYEWEENDSLLFAKKIPLFRVSFDTMKDFLTYHVSLKEEFLKQIAHKAIYQENDNIYASFLISDGKNSLALMALENGEATSISKLLVKDDNNLNEFMYTLPLREIAYEIGEKRKDKRVFRQYEKMKEFILEELNRLRNEKNLHKLKYLYYEWFKKEEFDIDKMYDDMIASLPNFSGSELSRMNYFIQLSYHQV